MKQLHSGSRLLKKIKIEIIFTVFILMFSITSCSAKTTYKNEQLQGKWYVNFVHQDIGQARTILEFDTASNSFTAHSRKNADKDILGSWTSFFYMWFGGRT